MAPIPSLEELLLNLLKFAVRDDSTQKLLEDIGRIIKISEEKCENTSKYDGENADYIIAAECDYIEELIGAAFLICQTKIRRVVSRAVDLNNMLSSSNWTQPITPFKSDVDIRAIGKGYKGYCHSFIEFVWTFGNYYKHRDEWDNDIWWRSSNETNVRGYRKSAIRTREFAQIAGIEQFSSGNLRTAYEFLDCGPYSNLEELATKLQDWADCIYAVAANSVKGSS